jgi:polyhydroxyalkanoate synthesis regulator phasin
MQATSQKPEGLNSGAAIRSYDDISSDRFATLSKRYDNVFVDGAYLVAETAKDIAEREGKYQTVYPNKDGTKEVDLPALKFLNDPFVIQCFTESSLPRSPAGRIQAVVEMVQAGMLTLKEGRRLMRTPQDLEQNEQLDNASEERIFKILDEIVEDGKYTPPDMFMDLQLANQLVVQYYNLYMAANLEEKKADMLRNFFTQIGMITQAGTPPPAPVAAPTANPEPNQTSPMVPNTNAAPTAA